jgi:hypothetical protein
MSILRENVKNYEDKLLNYFFILTIDATNNKPVLQFQNKNIPGLIKVATLLDDTKVFVYNENKFISQANIPDTLFVYFDDDFKNWLKINYAHNFECNYVITNNHGKNYLVNNVLVTYNRSFELKNYIAINENEYQKYFDMEIEDDFNVEEYFKNINGQDIKFFEKKPDFICTDYFDKILLLNKTIELKGFDIKKPEIVTLNRELIEQVNKYTNTEAFINAAIERFQQEVEEEKYLNDTINKNYKDLVIKLYQFIQDKSQTIVDKLSNIKFLKMQLELYIPNNIELINSNKDLFTLLNSNEAINIVNNIKQTRNLINETINYLKTNKKYGENFDVIYDLDC